MNALLVLWSSAIPELPLVMAGSTVIGAATCGLLLLCVFALWLERERAVPLPEPIHLDGEHRLAA